MIKIKFRPRKIQVIQNSSLISIPIEIVRSLNLEKGDIVDVSLNGSQIIVEKAGGNHD